MASRSRGATRRLVLACLVLAWPVFIGVFSALLGACSERGAEARLGNYLQRLSRALDADFKPPAPAPVPAPPRAPNLQLALEGSRVDGLDFLRLRGCALQTTVARRNSSLGRLAPPSQRLLLELAFLREAPACIDRLRDEDDEALAALLAEAEAQKHRQLPALIFNATLGNREFRDFWRGNDALDNYPEETSSLVVTALERIDTDTRRWLGGDYRADESRFELALSDISRGDGGELLRALQLQSAWLAGANRALDQRLSRGELCREGLLPGAAPILRSVVKQYFIAGIQPWSAGLNQRYHELLTPLQSLEQQLEAVLPDSYRQWRRRLAAILARGRAAPRQHVRGLQTLLGPCYAEFRRG